MNELVYGTSQTQGIVACEVREDGQVEIWTESETGTRSALHAIPQYLISDRPMAGSVELAGSLPLRHMKLLNTVNEWWNTRKANRSAQHLNIYDSAERAMQLGGFTFFKGMTPKDVSILSFDLETTGVTHDSDSRVLLISNTFRRNGRVTRRLFAYDEYESEGAMLTDWAAWVREMDPSLIIGHNIYLFDLPYIDYCARQNGVELLLGRDDSPLTFNRRSSTFRQDQANFYDFYSANIYGRNVVDTFFLSMRHDIVEKKYQSYGLKQIIKQEGLEREGREHYDASQIRLKYKDPAEWDKIKRYAEHDADDALALFDLMIPPHFYLAQSVPKTFQSLMVTAAGGQINSMLIRAYIQAGHSLPLPSSEVEFEGAISLGNPGVYRNVFKVDVASLYPSIMLEYQLFDKEKDPLGHTATILEYLTNERLKNKRLAKETGDHAYKSLSDSQKIIINSFYGFLGTEGLNFNAFLMASEVTRIGRELLQTAMEHAKLLGYRIVNADTDSISVEGCTDKQEFIRYLNKLFPDRIRWEDDGTYDRVLVLKTKNYILEKFIDLNKDPYKASIGTIERTIKGSALKAPLKEPALKRYMGELINLLLNDKGAAIPALYEDYVKQIIDLKDIKEWAFKKSISESILMGEQTTAKKVLDALQGEDYAQGDKRYLYFRKDGSLALVENWFYDHDEDRLLQKLYKTSLIFKTVFDTKQLKNYSLKKNKKALERIA